MQVEAPREGTLGSKASTMDDEVVILDEHQVGRTRGGKHSRLWPHRWGTFVWNRAMVLPTARIGVVDYWKDTNNDPRSFIRDHMSVPNPLRHVDRV